MNPAPPFHAEVAEASILLPKAKCAARPPFTPCKSVPVVLPAAPTLLITTYAEPAMERLGAEPGKLMEAPLLSWNVPVPLAISAPFAVLGLMMSPAVLPVAVTVALTLTLFEAVSVNVVLALQDTLSFTFTSPLPAAAPALLCRITAVVARLFESAAPVMSPPLAATVKSCGSTSQLPYSPALDDVLTLALSATSTCAAEVSMAPPRPPLGALASNVPPTWTVPAAMPPNSVMLPP